ncbi:MAG: Xaa-Pro dipeptidase, partial [Xanthomonadales bacterium]|nr:Xaa-Pro dipeptidase [Xanthomonadales bacterium]
VRQRVRQGVEPPHEFLELGHLLHDLRLFKSRDEIRQMRHAARIAAQAHKNAMRAAKTSTHEFEVEAELWREFRRHDAVPAYNSIVGSGANACVLHYVTNRDEYRDGDLLLIDAGAEFRGYASDITRTFPVNGRFSDAQREIYELVLDAQLAAIDIIQPGLSWIAIHDEAVRVLTAGLIRLSILKGTLKQNLEDGSYRRFYMHKTGHWLGLDVHDVGDYRIEGDYRLLEPGMVLTVEPGLYIPPGARGVAKKWQGIGVRIEDDVLVTKDGYDILSADAPKSVDEIEGWMAAA